MINWENIKKILKWVVLITIIIVALFSLYEFITIKIIPPQISQNISWDKFCDQFSGDVRIACINSTERCRIMPHEMSMLSCVAINTIKIDINTTQAVCEQLKEINDQKFCYADALSYINLTNAAKNQCDLINDTNRKIFCYANIFKRIDLNESLRQCDNLNESSQMYICKALMTIDYNRDEAKAYCEKIIDENIKKTCNSIS